MNQVINKDKIMPEQTIKCPKCGADLTEALTGQIEQVVKAKYEAEAAAKEKDYQAKLKKIQQQAKELEAKEQAVDEQIAKQLKTERENIADQKKALEAKRQEIENQVAQLLKAERGKLTKQIKSKLAEEQAEETEALEEDLAEQKKKVKEAKARELELRKQQQRLEEEKETFELTIQRKLDEERKEIAEQARKKAAEDQQFKIREKEDLIKSLESKIGDLQRKIEIGSQEAQGEAAEEELQELLERTFPYDKFEGIKKGVRGADILQTVRNSTGKECGTILWESKNTKEFSNKWIDKITTDQQQASADIAAIMSIALPKEVDNFGLYHGVWVADYKSAIGLCALFRETLIRVERERLVTQHQDSMKDVVYKYITGQEFTMRVKRIANAYIAMQKDLESERRAMNKIWSKREKQIATVIENVVGIHGSIEGLVGGQKALPEIETLSLESIAEEEELD